LNFPGSLPIVLSLRIFGVKMSNEDYHPSPTNTSVLATDYRTDFRRGTELHKKISAERAKIEQLQKELEVDEKETAELDRG
jgi:hypothetical protein